MDWQLILLAVIGTAGAIIGGGFVWRKVVRKTQNHTSSIRIVSQKNNKTKGDIVAGDSTKINNK